MARIPIAPPGMKDQRPRYTLGWRVGNHIYVAGQLPFDAMKDFSFITPLVSFNNVLVVGPAAPMRSVQDVIAEAKRAPGKQQAGRRGIQ